MSIQQSGQVGSGRLAMRRAGFTMTELLVTMGIVIVLVSILIVTVGGVRETARIASTRSLMTAMSQATSRFEEDLGYLPPILDNDRGLVDPVPITETVRDQDSYPKYLHDLQGWYSYTSPTEYLLGYGSHLEDGYGGPDWDSIPDGSDDDSIPDGQQRNYPGLRNPGTDGAWGSSNGLDFGGPIASRNPEPGGQIYGPYLELKNDSSLAALGWDESSDSWDSSKVDPATGQPAVYFPGDKGYDPDAAKVLVDAWGAPIRYYRINYPPGDLRGRFPSNYQVYPRVSDWRYAPKLSEFIALRPWEIEPGNASDYFFALPGGNKWGDFNDLGGGGSLSGDSTTTAGLQSARYAFLSGGPDQRIFNWHRTDYPDSGGNDGATFKDWLGHFPDRAADGDWYGLQPVGQHYRGEPWYQVPVTEEVNRDNVREIGS
ncbi:MAG: type II secretion system GspH family protein [Phycisphaerales bacterium]|nr:type II secretion system GspH family protein [Phycisphaerales bacterium]